MARKKDPKDFAPKAPDPSEGIEPLRADYKKRTMFEKEADAEFFLRYHVRKFSYRQIAEMWNKQNPGYTISHQTVFESLKEQTKDWRKTNQQFINRRMLKSLAVLDEVERVAWELLERSCQDGERITVTRSLPSLGGRGGDDDEYEDDEHKLMRFKALIDNLCDEDGLPPITKHTRTIEGQAGDSSFLRVIAQCQKIQVDVTEAITLESKMPDALIKFAKAIGVRVDDDDD